MEVTENKLDKNPLRVFSSTMEELKKEKRARTDLSNLDDKGPTYAVLLEEAWNFWYAFRKLTTTERNTLVRIAANRRMLADIVDMVEHHRIGTGGKTVVEGSGDKEKGISELSELKRESGNAIKRSNRAVRSARGSERTDKKNPEKTA